MAAISIRQTIYLLIIAPLVSVMGLTGIIVFLGGRQIVHHMGEELSQEVTEHIVEHTRNYLDRPHVILEGIQIVSKSKVGDLNNFPILEKYMWNLVYHDDSLSYIFYGDEQGRFLGVQQSNNNDKQDFVVKIKDESTGTKRHTYALDAQGQRKKLLSTPKDYDTNSRPWYQNAKKFQQSRWSSVYLSSSKSILSISPLVPVYNQGKLQGVLSIQISLADISNFLQELKNSRSLEAFIIDREGNIIASSANESPSISTAQGERRLQAVNSSEPIIKSTARQIRQQFADFNQIQEKTFFTFDIKGKRQLVQIVPLKNRQSLDWLVAVAIPETNFMSPVYRYTQLMVLTGLGLAGLAILSALKFASWIVKPISVFDRAAKDLEQEIYQPQLLDSITSREDEFGQLGRVFQLMATVVDQRESSLKQQVETLKQDRQMVHQSAVVTHLKIDRWQKLMAQSQEIRLGKSATIKKLSFGSRSPTQVLIPQDNEINILRSFPYLQNLKQIELEQLIQHSDRLDLGAGQYVYHSEDHPADKLYIILTGEVEIFSNPTQKPLTTLGFGEMFGEISLLFNTPRLVAVKTLEHTRLLSFPGDRLWELLKKHPELSEYIIHNVTEHKMNAYNLKHLLRKHKLLNYSFQTNPTEWMRNRLKSLVT